MKAKDLLFWCIENQIEFTGVDFLEIPDDEEFQSQADFLECFFGDANVKRHIPAGEYVYIYCDGNNADDLMKIINGVEIILHPDEETTIYLFRIEG